MFRVPRRTDEELAAGSDSAAHARLQPDPAAAAAASSAEFYGAHADYGSATAGYDGGVMGGYGAPPYRLGGEYPTQGPGPGPGPGPGAGPYNGQQPPDASGYPKPMHEDPYSFVDDFSEASAGSAAPADTGGPGPPMLPFQFPKKRGRKPKKLLEAM